MKKGLLKTLFTGRNLIRTESTVSTNNYAAELLANNEPIEGTAIMAEYQQNGRGQRGSNWISNHGENLLVSYVFYPKFITAQNQFHLNILISVATAQSLMDEGLSNVKIKWPNDIYAGSSKIAGILIENTIKGSIIASCIAGIGLNINQVSFPDFAVKATSMRLEKGDIFEKVKVFENLSNNLEECYMAVRNRGVDSLREKYLKLLYRGEGFHSFENEEGAFIARIISISPEGKLILEKKDGSCVQSGFKEIKFLPFPIDL